MFEMVGAQSRPFLTVQASALLLLLLPRYGHGQETDLSLFVTGYTTHMYRFGIDSSSLLFFDLDTQTVDSSMTWMVWDPIGESLYAAHEVDNFEGTGDGAISRKVVLKTHFATYIKLFFF